MYILPSIFQVDVSIESMCPEVRVLPLQVQRQPLRLLPAARRDRRVVREGVRVLRGRPGVEGLVAVGALRVPHHRHRERLHLGHLKDTLLSVKSALMAFK